MSTAVLDEELLRANYVAITTALTLVEPLPRSPNQVDSMAAMGRLEYDYRMLLKNETGKDWEPGVALPSVGRHAARE
jgi:hypothetical protein